MTSKIKLIKKSDFSSFVNNLIGSVEVYAPVGEPGKYKFAKIESPETIQMDYDCTLLPPKKVVFPHKGALLSFKRSDPASGKPAVETNGKKKVLLGVHPYDIHGIRMMDKYYTQEFTDTVYSSHRNNIAIIGLAMKKAPEYSFTRSLGTATAETGYDLMLTDIGDSYAVEVGTEKGEEFLKAGNFAEATAEAKAALLDYKDNVIAKFEETPMKWDSKEITAILDKEDAYGSDFWNEIGDKCLSCGSCVMVCPTCYCFDVQDEVDLKTLEEGVRNRHWDACTLEDFTLVGHPTGHREVFRNKASSRVRHRMYRKANYLAKRTGEFNCVGCGRCQKGCLSKIASPNENFNKISELVK